ncbi:hypothetical protein ACFY3G_45230 [Streptomyces phaeochromogenes]|uniref:hypothetical protein n=1 Tax=Streptomyces phaeochromogenes TaxID=1923 RepID=UPI00368331FB
MARTRTAVNRTVLSAVGLSLFLAGSWLTATDPAFADRLPTWWPTAGTGTVLLDRDRLAQLRGEGWWTPTVMAASIGLAVLFAIWSLGQSRSGRARRLALPSPGCTVRPQALAEALAEALAARVATLPGIARSRARVLPRRGQRLEVRLRVWLEPDTPPDAVLPAVRTATAEADRAATPYTAHTRVRLSTTPHRTRHVR